jgi:beta-lactamase superfamily II metal-dependent hydrolase
MYLEIDMLGVGNADALVIRVVDGWYEHVTVIDGGNPNDGRHVVDHLKNRTWRQRADVVICTHPDRDHIGGLFHLVQNIPVGEVWINDPREFIEVAQARRALREVGHLSLTSLRRLQESLQDNLNFVDLVDQLGIPRRFPLVDYVSHPHLTIVGPTPAFYADLLGNFDDPTHLLVEAFRTEELIEAEGSEVLDEKAETSAMNNSSVIVGVAHEGQRHLLTGDAGLPALWSAVETYDISGLHLMQVPHHGSRHNLSNALIQHFSPAIALISAAGTRKHPSRAVINALKAPSTGAFVASTHRTGNLWYRTDTTITRAGYSSVEPL